MPNALDADTAPRPPPRYTRPMPNALNANGPTFAQASPDVGGMPGGIVPVSDGAPPGNALNPAAAGAPSIVPPQGQQSPSPSHEQTVAALHHTSEVSKQLMSLMRDPELGKKDARSQIIDASLELVQKGLATVPAIVEQIKGLPSDPRGQLDWVKGHLLGNLLTQHAIFEHHRAAFPPTTEPWDVEKQRLQLDKKKKHSDIIGGLITHYRGPR
jgi:hypothetical protein